MAAFVSKCPIGPQERAFRAGFQTAPHDSIFEIQRMRHKEFTGPLHDRHSGSSVRLNRLPFAVDLLRWEIPSWCLV